MITPLESKDSRRSWRDPDDAAEISDKWIAEANLYHGKKRVRRGRSDTQLIMTDPGARPRPRGEFSRAEYDKLLERRGNGL
jgi:hypothetical protein